MATMWARLLTFLALAGPYLGQISSGVPPKPDFQEGRFLGRWHSIAIASNSQWFHERKGVMKMCTTVVAPADEGNLLVTSTYPVHGRCETKKRLFARTEQPGRYNYASPWSGTVSDVRVVETDYNDYALMLGKKVKDGKTDVVVTLYRRSKELGAELLQMFTNLALAQGLDHNDILILPRTGQCMDEAA